MLWQDVDGKERRLIFVKVRPCDLPVIFGPRLFIDIEGRVARSSQGETARRREAACDPEHAEPDFGDAPAMRCAIRRTRFQSAAASHRPLRAARHLARHLCAGAKRTSTGSTLAWDDPEHSRLLRRRLGRAGEDRAGLDLGRQAQGRRWARGGGAARLVLLQPGVEGAGGHGRPLSRLGLEEARAAGPRPERDAGRQTRSRRRCKRRRVLLILDGVEPLQHGPGPQEGLLKDPAMRALLASRRGGWGRRAHPAHDAPCGPRHRRQEERRRAGARPRRAFG